MTDAAGDKLVDEVVRRVLAVLGQGDAPASVAAPASAAVAEAPPQPSPPAAAAGRVWVTAEMLAGRADGARSVSLAMNEQLTPAARDYAASRDLEVLRGAAAPPPAPVTPPASGHVRPAVLTRTVGLVVNRPDAKVEAVLSAAARGGLATVGFGESDCWMVNTKSMARAVLAGQVAGGVLIDRYAAAAMVLAGKFKGIRAVQGVSAAAVTAALRQFDANVLVIGHATCSMFEVRSMIDRFAAGRRMGRDRTVLLDMVERVEAGT